MNQADLMNAALSLGATRAACLPVKDVVLSASFRDICASNACGFFDKCYMCPPDVGDIHELMARIGTYDCAVLYQSVHALEDSYDYEGMVEAGARHCALSQALEKELRARGEKNYLHLSAGGCRVCKTCMKRENQPCRFPDKAMASLESYGIDVYNTAKNANLKYVNGQNTVTYFGMVLWRED